MKKQLLAILVLVSSVSYAAVTTNLDQFSIDPDGTVVVRMTFTDNATFKKQNTYRLNPFILESLKSQVRGDLASFKTPEDPKQTLVIGPFDSSSTVIPPPPPPDPTPEEKARSKFIKDLFFLRQMQKAITLGVMTANDKEYTDQVNLVASEWLDSYLDTL